MDYEILKQRYYQNPLVTEGNLSCRTLGTNTRLRQEQAGIEVQSFEDWIKDHEHQYPNGF